MSEDFDENFRAHQLRLERAHEKARLEVEAQQRRRAVSIITPLVAGIISLIINFTPVRYAFPSMPAFVFDVIPIPFFLFFVLAVVFTYLQTGFRTTDDLLREHLLVYMRPSQYDFPERRFNSEIEEMRSELEALRSHVTDRIQTDGLLEPAARNELLNELKRRLEAEAGNDLVKSIESRISNEQRLKELSDEIKEPFEEVQLRLIAEIDSLGRRANLNLALGGLTTLVGLGFLGFFIIYAPENNNKLSQLEDLIHFAVHFVPRVTLVVFIEVFAYFFLRLYKANLAEIKFFQNELTNIESKYLGLRTALRANDPAMISEVVSKLSSTERNLGLIKDQTAADIERAKIEKEGLAEIFQHLSGMFSKRSG